MEWRRLSLDLDHDQSAAEPVAVEREVGDGAGSYGWAASMVLRAYLVLQGVFHCQQVTRKQHVMVSYAIQAETNGP
jgi:hypothetical protein